MPIAPVRQLERISPTARAAPARRAVHACGPRTRGGAACTFLSSVRSASRKWPNSRGPSTRPCGLVISSRQLTLRPLTFRLVATSRRFSHCGVNSRPGLRVIRGQSAGGLHEAVHALCAEQRLAHRDREIDEDAPFLARPRWRIDGAPSVLHVRFVVKVAGQRHQVVALQPVHGGQQPVRVAVTFPLYQVDRDQQVQLGERRVELGAVRSGHHGVAAVDHHRPNLSGPRCGDLVGQFRECVGTGDQVACRAGGSCAPAAWPCRTTSARRRSRARTCVPPAGPSGP